jgi:universal stress protein E
MLSEEFSHQPNPLLEQSSNDLKDVGIVERHDKLKRVIAPELEKIHVDLNVVCGNLLKEVIQQVLRRRHDLVIMAADLKERSTGRAVMQLVRKCPCSVWLIKPHARSRYTRIMAAVDPDLFDSVRNKLNRKITDITASMALKEGSEVHITNAWMAPAEGLLRGQAGFTTEDVSRYVGDVLRDRASEVDALLRTANVKTLKHRIHLVKGDAAKVIPELARRRHIDLLIVGTLSRTGIAGWFIGNTAEKLLRRVDCSVFVVKPNRSILSDRSKQNSLGSGHTANP